MNEPTQDNIVSTAVFMFRTRDILTSLAPIPPAGGIVIAFRDGQWHSTSVPVARLSSQGQEERHLGASVILLFDGGTIWVSRPNGFGYYSRAGKPATRQHIEYTALSLGTGNAFDVWRVQGH